MHTDLHSSFRDDPRARDASDLIASCVHCGFCLETCPTYLDRRDERDSPRGRIYLLRQLLQDGSAGDITRSHLDRCLNCRSCETTCPSGVRYGELLDLGQQLLEEKAPRPRYQRGLRYLLRQTLTRPWALRAGLRLGQSLRPLLPQRLRRAVPRRRHRGPLPPGRHSRRVLVLEGCVQSVATPDTNGAATRVLDVLGIQLQSIPGAGCCGALDYHLGARAEGLDKMRRNIDVWWPHIEADAEAVIATASGCGASIAEYGRLLAHDPGYARRAARISALYRDLSDILLQQDLAPLRQACSQRVALHSPCTLQHALGRPGAVEEVLRRVGIPLARTSEQHLCCGSAGSHSLLHPAAAQRLKTRKLSALCQDRPDIIATANIGCQLHLEGDAPVPVEHWIQLLDPARR